MTEEDDVPVKFPERRASKRLGSVRPGPTDEDETAAMHLDINPHAKDAGLGEDEDT